MGYTAGVIRGAGDIISAADWNAQVASNVNWLAQVPRGYYDSYSTSLTGGGWYELLRNNGNVVDGMGWQGQGFNIPEDGRYLFCMKLVNTVYGGGQAQWSIGYSYAGSYREINSHVYPAGWQSTVGGSDTVDATAGSKVCMAVNQNAGATTIPSGSAICTLTRLTGAA